MTIKNYSLDPSEMTELVWKNQYRLHDVSVDESDLNQTLFRVARAVAEAESTPEEKMIYHRRFLSLLKRGDFIPGGRVLAGAGSDRHITLSNCFVMGRIEDSMEGLFEALKEGALTMQQGGGIGYDFSTLRPHGSLAHRTGTTASGPVSFMHIWDSMCATVLSTGNRRGAMMATLRCDHPDIEAFVTAKSKPGTLQHLNLSVLITDDFIQAVQRDELWPLIFPVAALAGSSGEIVYRRWSGNDRQVACRVMRRLPARTLWQQLLHQSYQHAEPGVLFIDTINRENNLAYRELISATNPCGEIPLPSYGACVLGSINLVNFVQDPFTISARFNWEKLRRIVRLAVRFLDNVIDISSYPLAAQMEEAQGTRRVGLGITGLADSLIMHGLHYGSPEARQVASHTMRTICHTAYRASSELARRRGVFPYFKRALYCQSPFVQRLPKRIRMMINSEGVRNSHLLAIAPTGTISLLAGNVSPGLEPVFGLHHHRRFRQADGSLLTVELQDWAYHLWHTSHPNGVLPPAFVTMNDLKPADHLLMQACLQPFVDNAISKTINLPSSISFMEFQHVFQKAHMLGLKGLTVFRRHGQVKSVLL